MESRTVITLNKDDDSNVESCCVNSDARHPRVCLIEAMGRLCRHGRIIYFFLEIERKKRICNSQSKD